jgi:hypothetical protein
MKVGGMDVGRKEEEDCVGNGHQVLFRVDSLHSWALATLS